MSIIPETFSQTNTISWSVAIFTARESIWTLTKCLSAVLVACRRKEVTIDILVNGNRPLADEAAGLVNSLERDDCKHVVRVWFIPFGDKAHAWNEYVYRVWKTGGVAYFIDGYVEVAPDAMLLIYEGLKCNPDTLGATGVPTSGPSAAALRKLFLEEGGLHGNLYAVRGTILSALQHCQFRLPLGLYRTDSLLGAVLNYGLNPAKHGWNKDRILVHSEATWQVRQIPRWYPTNVIAQFKRMLRQAQGMLENRAVREHLTVSRYTPQTLPRTANELVAQWIVKCPSEATQVFRRYPLTLYARQKLRQKRDWSPVDFPPVLLSSTGKDTAAAGGADEKTASQKGTCGNAIIAR
jgi:hypothetical protein